MESIMVNSKKGPIEYVMKGKGPVIMILHGTSSDCHSDTSNQALIDAGYTVLAPSRPGYGRTPASAGTTAEEAADAMISLLDSLNISKVYLIAISGGGPTGIHMAAKYPERIEKLVLEASLSDPSLDQVSKRQKQIRVFYGPLHNLMWKMLRYYSIKSPLKMVRQTMITFSSHDVEDIMANVTDDIIASVQKFYSGNSSAKGARMDYGHRTGKEVMSRIKAPTLIVHSREDRGVAFEHAESAAEHIPGSELYTAKVWGHFFWFGPGSAEIIAKIIGFLKAEQIVDDKHLNLDASTILCHT